MANTNEDMLANLTPDVQQFMSPDVQHHLNHVFTAAAAEVFKHHSSAGVCFPRLSLISYTALLQTARAMLDSLNKLTETVKDPIQRKAFANEMQVRLPDSWFS